MLIDRAAAARPCVAVLAALSLSACSANTPRERAEHSALPLYDAVPAQEASGVALLSEGSVACSGTLIAPRVVLTAAHCLHPELFAFVGPDTAGPGAWRQVLLAQAHPDFDAATGEKDIALLLLSSPITEEVAYPDLSSEPAPLEVGDPLWVLGYGSGDVLGSQRIGRVVVSDLEPGSITTAPDPSRPCGGDSGGPVFGSDLEDKQLVAVVSRGDADCASYAKLARLDWSAREFIGEFVDAYRDGSRETGESCKFDDQCVEERCVTPDDAPARRYCSAACSEPEACPLGMSCEAGECRWPMPSPGADGGACNAAADCESGVCAGYPRSCRVRCLPEQAACGAGQECRQLADSVWGACLDTSAVAGGCSLCKHRSAPTPGLLVALAWLVARRRRRALRSKR
jgi:hypothetical protein